MSVITSVEVIAAGPRMPAVRFTEALPAVHTTVTFVLITTEDDRLGIGSDRRDPVPPLLAAPEVDAWCQVSGGSHSRSALLC